MNRQPARMLGVVLAALVASAGIVAPPQAAAVATQLLQWDEDGSTFATFGANAAVTIAVGTIGFYCDAFFPTADIYVIKAGGPVIDDDYQLVDVNGQPNTVFGASGGFFSDTIAFTRPGGNLGRGTYSVIYDECQDGSFDTGVDSLFPNAFQVTLAYNAPSLSTTGIAAIKAGAATEAVRWTEIGEVFGAIQHLENLEKILECAKDGPEACLGPLGEMADSAIGGDGDEESAGAIDLETLYEQTIGFFAKPPWERVKDYAEDAAADMVKHYKAINADPPDPAFLQPTALAPAAPLVGEGEDALTRAQARLANLMRAEARLAEVVLHDMERYQGAALGGDAEWVLAHARAFQRDMRLLADLIGLVDDGLEAVRAALAADDREFDAAAAVWTAERARLMADGFTPDQLRILANIGVAAPDLSVLFGIAEDMDVGGFSVAGSLATLDAARASGSAYAGDLRAAADDLDAIIATIAADPDVTGVLPIADAGGPYAGVAGAAFALDATASSGANEPLAFAWDTDADGAFDDATGVSPSVELAAAPFGLLGVRVTDALGGQSVDYAIVTLAGTNSSPQIVGTLPPTSALAATPGDALAFSVAATDPDADPIAISWDIDGSPAGVGPSFGWTVLAGDIGSHRVHAAVSDGTPGGTAIHAWTVYVLPPDSDADGWTEPLDCNDANAAINPGAAEVQGNGLDDDCSIYTIDGGVADSSITLPITVRDFLFSHPDFEHAGGDDRGIVEALLGPDGKPVYASATTTLTTSGKANFDQWYNDVPGVNVTVQRALTLNQVPGSDPPIYRVEMPSFFPVNGDGWEVGSTSSNFAFTVEGHSSFTYRGGEIFSFIGDDDVWVFINGHLVIDLGGVHPAESASVALDAVAAQIGIVPGGTYPFEFFSAERHTVGSTLFIDTSIALHDAAAGLQVRPQATPALGRQYAWAIDNTAEPSSWDAFDGDTVTSRFVVDAQRELIAIDGALTGEVCLENTTGAATQGLAVEVTALAGLVPALEPVAGTTVDVSGNATLDQGESDCYAYAIPLDGASVLPGATYRIVADATSEVPGQAGTGAADVTLPGFGEAINGTIEVGVGGGELLVFDGSGSQAYERTWTCPIDDGAHSSTASVPALGLESTASVAVSCHRLAIESAATTLLRTTHAWTIEKSADQSSLRLARNESFGVNYDVAVAEAAMVEAELRGTVAISNPAPIPVTIEGLTQLVVGNVADVHCDQALPVTLPPGAVLACSFRGIAPGEMAGAVSATATVRNHAYDPGHVVAGGTSDVSGSTAFDASLGAAEEVDECIDVTDSLAGLLGSACAGNATQAFTYLLVIGPFETSTEVVNTATFVARDSGATGTAAWPVSVSIPATGCTLTIGYWKTHAGSGPQRDMVTPLLPIWLGTSGGAKSVQVGTAQLAIAILGMEGDSSNGMNRLGAQLLAARLSILSGADPAAVASVLASADAFLAGNAASGWKQLSKAQQKSVVAWATTLELYNRGLIGPGHCSE